MSNKFKYITASEEDKEWGLNLSVAGTAVIDKNINYPPPGHPIGHSFNWNAGRVLQEYQINYVTEGYGTFENKYGTFRITPGSIIVIFPGEWHRYRPLKNTGWKEHYIGFYGTMVPTLLKHDFFKKENPIIKVNFHNQLHEIFLMVLENVFNEKAGYQQICTGLVITYIGLIISEIKNKEFEGKDVEKRIQQACFILRENLNSNIDARKLASDLNTGYSYFRNMFKKYTGMSPVQYHLQLRIKKAENLLLMTQKPIKEIAYELGFQSVFYFSRLFKLKTGKTPSQIRTIYNSGQVNP
jgi:AraC-like DNA-binding protein